MTPNLARQRHPTKQSDGAGGVGEVAASLASSPVWALVGPTAVGKSAMAMELAEWLPADIVNCDSVQCYEGFVIGAAQPSAEAQMRVPHHLIGFSNPVCDARLDVHGYVTRARAVIDTLADRDRRALLCGGSGLYARAFRDGVADVQSDAALRNRLTHDENHTPGIIYQRLLEQDPDSAARIGPHNPARLLRALEMVTLTGQPLSQVFSQQRLQSRPVTLVALDARRAWLLPRIEQRVDAMLAAGFIEEVESLLARGVSEDLPPMRAVGYREVRSYLKGALSRDALAAAIITRTWQYARRQRTWLRREPDVRWIDAEMLFACAKQQRRKLLRSAFEREAGQAL